MHLLMECEFFDNERFLYLGIRRFRVLNAINFARLLNAKSSLRLLNIAKFMNVILSVFSR